MKTLFPVPDIDAGRVAYRPSNRTEGEIFMSDWCVMCERDRAHREGDGDSCPIAAATMAFDVDDPEYPKEWRRDGPQGPRCTAFEEAEES